MEGWVNEAGRAVAGESWDKWRTRRELTRLRLAPEGEAETYTRR